MRAELIEPDHKLVVLNHDHSFILAHLLDLLYSLFTLFIYSEAITVDNHGAVLAELFVHAVRNSDVATLTEEIFAVAFSHGKLLNDILRFRQPDKRALTTSRLIAPFSELLRSGYWIDLIVFGIFRFRVKASIVGDDSKTIVPHKRISRPRFFGTLIEFLSQESDRVSSRMVEVFKDGELLLVGNRGRSD